MDGSANGPAQFILGMGSLAGGFVRVPRDLDPDFLANVWGRVAAPSHSFSFGRLRLRSSGCLSGGRTNGDAVASGDCPLPAAGAGPPILGRSGVADPDG